MHAFGTDEDYVRAAIDAGFEEIGFSDHSPWPFKSGYVSSMRMGADKLEDYALSVMKLREKYKDKIKIRLGLECEYFEEYLPWLCAECEKFGIEYVEDDSDEDSVSILMCDEDYNNMTPEEQNAYPLICLLQKMYDTDNAEVENEEEKN